MNIQSLQQIQEIYGVPENIAVQIQHNQLLEDQVGELTKIRKLMERKELAENEKHQKANNVSLGFVETNSFEFFEAAIKTKVTELMEKETIKANEGVRSIVYERLKGMFLSFYKELSLSYARSTSNSHIPNHEARKAIITRYQEELLTVLNLPRE